MSDIPYVNQITKVFNVQKIRISTVVIGLDNTAEINICLLDDSDEVVEMMKLKMESSDYEAWSGDSELRSFIVSKVNQSLSPQ